MVGSIAAADGNSSHGRAPSSPGRGTGLLSQELPRGTCLKIEAKLFSK